MAAPQVLTYFQTYTVDPHGNIELTGVLDITNFNMVNLEIINFPSSPQTFTVAVLMGKISGQTLAQEIDNFSLKTTATIQTYSVVGPELSILIQGPPPRPPRPPPQVNIQAWVFLH